MAAPAITTVYKTYETLETFTKDVTNISSDSHNVILVKRDPMFGNSSSIKYHNELNAMAAGDILFISGSDAEGYQHHAVKLAGSVSTGFALPTDQIGNGWKPVGVCVIPGPHTPDGLPVILDIADLASCKLQTGNAAPIISERITKLKLTVYELITSGSNINIRANAVEYTLSKSATNNITPIIETGNNNSLNPVFFVNNGVNSKVSNFTHTASAVLHGTLKHKAMHMTDNLLSASQLNNIKLPVWPYTSDGYGKFTTEYSVNMLNYDLSGEYATNMLISDNLPTADPLSLYYMVDEKNSSATYGNILNWYVPSFAEMCYITSRWFTIQNSLRMLKANSYTDVNIMSVSGKYGTSSFLSDTTDKRQMVFDASQAQFIVNSYLNATDILYRLVSKVRD